MRTHLFAAALSAAPLLLLASPAEAARPEQVDSDRSGAVPLRFTLQRGQSRAYTLTGRQTREGLEGTAGDISDLDVSLSYTYEVQSVGDDGTADIAASLTGAEVSYAINGEEEETDEILSGIRDARLTLRAADDGSLRERNGSVDTRIVSPDIGSFLQDTFSQVWVQFPEEPVSIGDSWLQVIPLSLSDSAPDLEANINVRYTLAGFANVGGAEHAVIDAEYSTEIDGNMAFGPGGRLLRVVGRGIGEGHILFNPAAGAVSEIHVESGTVLTATETNGRRTARAFSTESTLRLAGLGSGEDATE